MAKQPHIIIFNPDEMRADTMGHLGNPAAYTPFLDEFAATQAVSFRNAYCQNPVCVPSRCSFFTGLYPHVHGHRTMSHLFHPHETSLLKELRDAGYYVWMNDRNDFAAGQIPGWVERHATEIFYANSSGKDIDARPVNPGFRGEPGGRHYYSHMHGLLQSDAQGLHYNADDEAVDAAIARIHNRPEGQPLCIFLGLMYPHPPYEIEEYYLSKIDRSRLRPRVRASECTGKAKILDSIRGYTNMERYTEQEWDDIRATYLAMTAKIDAQFGRLVQALKDAGIYDDCAIFFFSDHGDFAGEYDLVEKAQNSFEDCLTRVPFLIKPPAWEPLDAGTSDSLTELVDFYATAMAMAGVAPTHSHYGRDLRPVLADRTRQLREFACCEGGRNPGELHCDEYHCLGPGAQSPKLEYWPKKMAQCDDVAHGKGIMLRTARYKYVSRTQERDELYDLEQDPDERVNRIEDPALKDVAAELRWKLLKWLQTTDDVVPFEMDARFTPEMLWHKVRRMVPERFQEEAHARIQQGMLMGEAMAYAESLRKRE